MALQIEKIKYAGNSKIISALCTKINAVIDAAGSGGGGGSTVIVDPILQSGTKIAEIEVDDTTKEIYAPTPPTKTSDLTNDSGYVTSSALPTKVSDLTNDTGFITNTVNNLTNYYTKSQTYTQTEVDALISAIVTLNISVVQTLPTQDVSTTTIYLVPKQTAGTDDIYDEYIYVNGAWECIGSTSIDLSNYYTKLQVDDKLDTKYDNISGTELKVGYNNGPASTASGEIEIHARVSQGISTVTKVYSSSTHDVTDPNQNIELTFPNKSGTLATRDEIFDMIYPVGSIYMSINNVNPGNLFGGTWEAWGSGRVPVGVNANDADFDTVEETGGAKSSSYTPAGSNTDGAVQSHTLTTNEIPAHTHGSKSLTGYYQLHGAGDTTGGVVGGVSGIIKPRGAISSNKYRTQLSLPQITGANSYTAGFDIDATHTHTSVGGNKGHTHNLTQPTFTGTAATISRLQPYITCYMWKRTA